MTKAMPFLQKAILLSYDPRRFGKGDFLLQKAPVPITIQVLLYFFRNPQNR